MPVLSRDEFFERVSQVVGERSDDEAISFIEDMTETYDAISAGGDPDRVAELEQRIIEIDRAWREKYKERFFNAKSSGRVTTVTAVEDENGDYKETVTFEDLFKKKEE